ncbi:Protein of unknown function [Lactobacillus helveticus CIRM-BIA 103]|nr:Protein of unknown function [Lactobacillus helveticus CIRM-BIA 103]
MRLSFSGKS